jgi:membrane-associated phospholipid phosphatase
MSAPAHASGQDPPGLAAASPRRALRRALVRGAPLAYVAALVIVTLSWGLPVARDQLFFWVLLGLAAFGIGAWRSWGALLLAWLPLFAVLMGYDYLRGAVSVDAAQAHVAPQIAVDRWLGGGEVPTLWLQRHLWDAAHPHWYDYGAWLIYLTHFFVVWLVAAALWRASRRRFAHYAVVTVVLTLAAFVVFWRYPAQPPWLASDGLRIGPVDRIVPLVWDRLGVTTVKSVYENSAIVNPVAAVPSLHAAYPMMLVLFFWDAGRRVRAGLALYAVAMAWALVYGGEHFVSDILAGWAMAAAVYALVGLAARTPTPPRRRRSPIRHARERAPRGGRNAVLMEFLKMPPGSS